MAAHCIVLIVPTLAYPGGQELTTAEWRRVFEEAAQMGVLHVGFSGGEPLRRTDLAELVAAARATGFTQTSSPAPSAYRAGAPLNCAKPDWTVSKSAFNPTKNLWRTGLPAPPPTR